MRTIDAESLMQENEGPSISIIVPTDRINTKKSGLHQKEGQLKAFDHVALVLR